MESAVPPPLELPKDDRPSSPDTETPETPKLAPRGAPRQRVISARTAAAKTVLYKTVLSKTVL